MLWISIVRYYNENNRLTMPETRYQFYQCENSNCGLRFPGYEGYPRWNRCPLCRSNTHIVAIVENISEKTDKIIIPGKLPIEVILDNIRSALNVGSIFRTSDGTGIKKIYCCGITPSPENPKVKKTSLGAEVDIPWESSNNGLLTAIKLKSHGRALWALEDSPNAESLFQVELPLLNSPLVIIIGNEVSGVDPGIIGICDKVISIPMVGKKNSYNVAIAFGITASYFLYRFWYKASN
jgi:23S rRNA (guanosine2251-2'-O)-methyltransferase